MGALAVSVVALRGVAFRACSLVLNVKRSQESFGFTVNCGTRLPGETDRSRGMVGGDGVRQRVRQVFATLELTTMATGGGYKIVILLLCNFMQL